MTRTKIAGLLSALALLASLPLTVALAQGAPYLVVGSAMLDDEPAMMGTMVVAMVGEEKVGDGEVFNEEGHYRLQITGGNQGDTVMISLMMGEGDEAMEYMAMTDEDVIIGAPGAAMMADLMASTDPAGTRAVATMRPAAEVFQELVDRLVLVWYLDGATQTWSFYDPDPEVAAFNTLVEVSSGDVVSVVLSAGDTVEFQGYTLYAGRNPICLN